MTKADIINKFHLYMDDTTELSTQEESDLFDKIYNKVMAQRPWEITKTEATGVIAIVNGQYEMDLPDDFAFLTANHNSTGNDTYAENPVIFVGTSYDPYTVVNWSDRRQYRTKTGFAYIDIANMKLVFTGTPTAGAVVEFDYHAVPAALTSAESPVFPARFHDIIYHGMCTDEFVIEQSDKAKSYRAENQKLYDGTMDDMAYWNAKLIQM